MTPLTRVLFYSATAAMLAGLVLIGVGLYKWHVVAGHVYTGVMLYWAGNVACKTIRDGEKPATKT
jgi:hypothetical protein